MPPSRLAGVRTRPAPDDAPVVDVDLHGFAHGGEAVGRLPDGKVCFVPYAIPGERVRVAVVDERRRWARARLLEVLDPSPDRVEPPCPYFGPERCGGCRLQHIAPARQAQLKQAVVAEQLAHLGGIADPPVPETVRVGDLGYRSSARFAVDAQGRLGFRRPGSHAIEPIGVCLLLSEAAQATRDEAGDGWDGVAEVTVRAGSAEGRGLVVTPGAAALPPLPAGDLPVALRDDTGATVALRGDATVVEEVGGARYRVSPGSFFQPGAAGAEALLERVRDAAGVTAGEQVLDLYAGVGLFARALAADRGDVVAIEGDASACDDARANLDGLPARVVCDDVRRALTTVEAADVVVLDPPRKGAGQGLCRRITELDPRVVVYVSCDPAALARDAKAFVAAGYRLATAVPVDQFAHTAQIETVATFVPLIGR